MKNILELMNPITVIQSLSLKKTQQLIELEDMQDLNVLKLELINLDNKIFAVKRTNPALAAKLDSLKNQVVALKADSSANISPKQLIEVIQDTLTLIEPVTDKKPVSDSYAVLSKKYSEQATAFKNEVKTKALGIAMNSLARVALALLSAASGALGIATANPILLGFSVVSGFGAGSGIKQSFNTVKGTVKKNELANTMNDINEVISEKDKLKTGPSN